MQKIIAPILGNRVLVTSVGVWTVAQVLKVIIGLIKEGKLTLSYLFTMGKMPSSHAALVCALATCIAVTDGLVSSNFALAAIFAAIVMYDAAGVRQAVSDNATILNRMLDELFEGNPDFEKHARELIGHTRLEVVAGGLLGIILALWWI